MVNRLNRSIYLNRKFQHILFWCCMLMFQTFIDASYSLEFSKFLIIQLFRLPVALLVVYFNLYFLLPRFLLKNKYAAYLGSLFTSMIFAGILQRFVVVYFIVPIYPFYCTLNFFNFYIIGYDIIAIYPVVALTSAIKLLRNWYKVQSRHQELEKESMDAELKFLKTQINPHFFFNTLNNLYALTLIKSDDAPKVVLKLSGLMDYMLYEGNAPYVSLKREVEHVENYLALEKLRFGDRLDLKLNINGELGDKEIAPMLILPFLENSFKHGVSELIQNCFVYIDLIVLKDELILSVENSKPDESAAAKEKECIGLKNVKRRLDLLYKNRFRIDIVDNTSSFKVVLNLSFKSPYEN
ncbi:MAG: sensor histidine kinase [Daejeonella sp.]|nr:sensor histidine kinase [Daejeonella sp.]